MILNQVVIHVKKGKGLKILTNKQMLNRLPVLLAQIKQEIILKMK